MDIKRGATPNGNLRITLLVIATGILLSGSANGENDGEVASDSADSAVVSPVPAQVLADVAIDQTIRSELVIRPPFIKPIIGPTLDEIAGAVVDDSINEQKPNQSEDTSSFDVGEELLIINSLFDDVWEAPDEQTENPDSIAGTADEVLETDVALHDQAGDIGEVDDPETAEAQLEVEPEVQLMDNPEVVEQVSGKDSFLNALDSMENMTAGEVIGTVRVSEEEMNIEFDLTVEDLDYGIGLYRIGDFLSFAGHRKSLVDGKNVFLNIHRLKDGSKIHIILNDKNNSKFSITITGKPVIVTASEGIDILRERDVDGHLYGCSYDEFGDREVADNLTGSDVWSSDWRIAQGFVIEEIIN